MRWRVRSAMGSAVRPGSAIVKGRKINWVHSNGEDTGDEDIARLSPLMHGHINMLGHYTFTLPEDILKGEMRTLNFNLNNELRP